MVCKLVYLDEIIRKGSGKEGLHALSLDKLEQDRSRGNKENSCVIRGDKSPGADLH